MLTTRTSLHLLLFLALTGLGTTCNRPEVGYQYRFSEKVSLISTKTAYHVNDTIWLSYINNDHSFFDTNTKQRVVLDSTSLSLPLFYTADYSYSLNSVPVGGFCDFIALSGTSSGIYNGQGSNVLSAYVKCANRIDLRLGIIPKTKGSYIVSLSGEGYIVSCSNKQANPSTVKYTFTGNQVTYTVKVE